MAGPKVGWQAGEPVEQERQTPGVKKLGSAEGEEQDLRMLSCEGEGRKSRDGAKQRERQRIPVDSAADQHSSLPHRDIGVNAVGQQDCDEWEESQDHCRLGNSASHSPAAAPIQIGRHRLAMSNMLQHYPAFSD